MIRTLSGKQTSFLKAVGRGDPADGFFCAAPQDGIRFR